jgi:hypothetical protein
MEAISGAAAGMGSMVGFVIYIDRSRSSDSAARIHHLET